MFDQSQPLTEPEAPTSCQHTVSGTSATTTTAIETSGHGLGIIALPGWPTSPIRPFSPLTMPVSQSPVEHLLVPSTLEPPARLSSPNGFTVTATPRGQHSTCQARRPTSTWIYAGSNGHAPLASPEPDQENHGTRENPRPARRTPRRLVRRRGPERTTSGLGRNF